MPLPPPPWTAYDREVVGPDAGPIAMCCDEGTARAVSALHELVEACEAAERLVADPSALLLIRTALAKARGL